MGRCRQLGFPIHLPLDLGVFPVLGQLLEYDSIFRNLSLDLISSLELNAGRTVTRDIDVT